MPIKMPTNEDTLDSYSACCYDDSDEMVTSSIGLSNSGVSQCSSDESEELDRETVEQDVALPKKRGPKKKPMTKARVVKMKVR